MVEKKNASMTGHDKGCSLSLLQEEANKCDVTKYPHAGERTTYFQTEHL